MKNALEYFNSLEIDNSARLNIATVLYKCPPHHMGKSNYVHTLKRIMYPDSFEISDRNLLGLMETMNLMVKHEACPVEIRNAFYRHKQKTLNTLYHLGRVTEAFDEGNYWSITVDGKYSFHQPKLVKPNGFGPISGVREYKNDKEALPFDPIVYQRFLTSVHYFNGHLRWLEANKNE